MADVDKVQGAGGAGDAEPAPVANLASAARRAAGRGPPPVHLWNPPFCGDVGMRIARDGTWFYRDSPIGRPALVKLFASILRKDPDRHVLVTPVEMVSIEVEDAPFLAVEMRETPGPHGRELRLRTNVDDEVVVGADHPLRFEPGPSDGLKPYVRVRGDLWALLTRPLFLDLVELGETREVGGHEMFGVASAGVFFPMAPADDVEASA